MRGVLFSAAIHQAVDTLGRTLEYLLPVPIMSQSTARTVEADVEVGTEEYYLPSASFSSCCVDS